MEGERRKRKLENEEEESEAQKMEKFFALIKSTKNARDLLSKDKQDKKDDEEMKGTGIWNPTFQPEDFIDYQAPSSSSNPPGSSTKQEQVGDKEPEATAPQNEDKEKGSDNLDLTLSL